MKLSVNWLIQMGMLLIQAVNATMDMLPPKGKLWAAVAISVIQGAVGVLAHFSNPDGTSAEEPWRKP